MSEDDDDTGQHQEEAMALARSLLEVLDGNRMDVGCTAIAAVLAKLANAANMDRNDLGLMLGSVHVTTFRNFDIYQTSKGTVQ